MTGLTESFREYTIEYVNTDNMLTIPIECLRLHKTLEGTYSVVFTGINQQILKHTVLGGRWA